MYGTTTAAVHDVLNAGKIPFLGKEFNFSLKGKICILDIDVQGVKAVTTKDFLSNQKISPSPPILSKQDSDQYNLVLEDFLKVKAAGGLNPRLVFVKPPSLEVFLLHLCLYLYL